MQGCPVDSSPPVAGIQGVDLAFRSVLPGSAFVNEVPPTSTLLHLPFEDTPDGNGQLVVRDVSGAGHNGACSGTTCPVTGQQGHSGSAAFFDGQDDVVMPGTTYFSLPVRDEVLHYGWNLVSQLVNPGNPDVQAVQRGIDGAYSTILGYEGEPLAYYSDHPQDSTLTTINALHGYWIQTILPPTATLTETVDDSAAIWRMPGEILPEDQPLSLASGWNLIGYLPARSLTVTLALDGIAGQYGVVLGFEYSALSYYPDLDPSYNTLVHMAPGHGYWISATEAITLQYPVTSITNNLPITATQMARERLNAIRTAEWQAGVQPTKALLQATSSRCSSHPTENSQTVSLSEQAYGRLTAIAWKWARPEGGKL